MGVAVKADGDLDADGAQAAVAILKPAPQPPCDEREHRVVDRRALDLVGRAVQGSKPCRGKGDRSLAADPTVEGGAAPRARSLTHRGRQSPEAPLARDRAP